MSVVVYKRPVSTNPALVTIATLFTFHLKVLVYKCCLEKIDVGHS